MQNDAEIDESQAPKPEWQTPEVSVCDISEQTQNNFNGAGSDGKFFS